MTETVTRRTPRRRSVGNQPQVSWSEVGRRIKALRAERNLAAKVVAGALGLDSPKMTKIESGERKLGPIELGNLAALLNVAPGYILYGPQEPNLTLAARLAEGENLGSLRSRAVDVLRLEEFLGAATEVRAPRSTPEGEAALRDVRETFPAKPRTRDEAARQGRKAAAIVREHLGLGDNPVGDLPELLEMNFAVDVVIAPLGDASGGLCAQSDDRAVFVASSAAERGRVRFTLAHELGHYVFGDPRSIIDEQSGHGEGHELEDRRVDAFAGAFLLPEAAIVRYMTWRGATRENTLVNSATSLRAVADLADKYGLSIHAVAVGLAIRGMTPSANDLLDAVRALPPAQRAGTYSSGMRSDEVRSPERLLDAAVAAAAARRTGTGPLSVLMNRDDRDALYDEYVGTAAVDAASAALLDVAFESGQ